MSKDYVVPPLSDGGQLKDVSARHATMRFPVPWTTRVQTPLRPALSSPFWTQPVRYPSGG